LSVRAAAILALALAALPPLAAPQPAAESAAAAAARILAEMPPGSPAARAAWIYGRACQIPDARVAMALLEEMPGRGPAEWRARARLWRARYWMAADSLDRAAAELTRIEGLSPTDPWYAEAMYWREMSGLEPGPARPLSPDGRAASAWEARARVASLGTELGEPLDLRSALALEGEARRHGLLGPWLWLLALRDESALRRAARDAVGASGFELVHAPEAAQWASGGGLRPGAEEAAASRPQASGETGTPASGGQGDGSPASSPLPAGVEALAAAGPSGAQPPMASGPQAGDARQPIEPAAGAAGGEQPLVPARAAEAPGGSPGRFVVEVRLMPEELAAARLAAELARHGFPAGAERVAEAPGEPLHRVFLGPCASAAEARALGEALHDRLMLSYRVIERP